MIDNSILLAGTHSNRRIRLTGNEESDFSPAIYLTENILLMTASSPMLRHADVSSFTFFVMCNKYTKTWTYKLQLVTWHGSTWCFIIHIWTLIHTCMTYEAHVNCPWRALVYSYPTSKATWSPRVDTCIRSYAFYHCVCVHMIIHQHEYRTRITHNGLITTYHTRVYNIIIICHHRTQSKTINTKDPCQKWCPMWNVAQTSAKTELYSCSWSPAANNSGIIQHS